MAHLLLTKLAKRFLRKLFSFLPVQLKSFYYDFRYHEKYVDRSEVILFTTLDSPLKSLTKSSHQIVESAEKKVNVSLITTIRNESSSIEEWFSSVLDQERWPDEIVIVDGGSSDGTIDKIKNAVNSFPIPIKLICQNGINIARGRNIAIESSSYSIVACTDFGCTLDPRWLSLLITPIESDPTIQVSMGYYRTGQQGLFANLSTLLFGLDIKEIDPQKFLPSSRSIAMRKSFWEQAGRYPEWLTRAGEDTLFDFRAKSIPAKWAFVPQAVVYWKNPNSLWQLTRTYYRYAFGDGESGVFSDRYWYLLVKNIQRFTTMILFVFLIVIFSFISRQLGYILVALWLAKEIITTLHDSAPIRDRYGNWYFFFPALREFLGLVQMLGFTRGVMNRPLVKKREVSYYGNELRKILQDYRQPKGIIVYPPTHDWKFMFQRPQQIACSMARRGYLYFYCTQNEREDSVFGFQKVEDNLYLCSVPFEVFSNLQQPIVYLGSAWNKKYLTYFSNPIVVYDHYDELEVSGASEKDHYDLLKRADIVVVSNKQLLEKVKKHREDALYVPNGVDYQYIKAQTKNKNDPPLTDLEEILNRDKPIVGYSGALASWFDYELLSSVAKIRQDWEFILVGTDYDGSLRASDILELSNVHWLGMKPYSTLFRYITKFDVGIIPFKLISITLSTSPIKLYEYMACGVPVVSVPIPECERIKEVLIAGDTRSFIECIEKALQLREDINYLKRIDLIARRNTWDIRVNKIVARLHSMGYESPIHS